MKRIFYRTVIIIFLVAFFYSAFTVFFDQAVLVRKNTFYLGNIKEKVIALTFDDGPSPEWTPRILDELRKENVSATFFLLGKHVAQYPDIVRRIQSEGHEIGNHTYNHPVLLFSGSQKLKKEISDTEKAIFSITGKHTILFRPPKAWLTNSEKQMIKGLGYKVVLWTLNSKDWVTFDDKYIVRYLVKRIKPGDIILFHDSGGVFKTEGGNRTETVKTIPRLIAKLRDKGYRFVTVGQLLEMENNR